MDLLCLAVSGSSEAPYEVAFEKIGTRVLASCSCAGGQARQVCKHRLSLINGEFEAVATGDPWAMAQLADILTGSDLAAAYAQVNNGRTVAGARKAASRRHDEGHGAAHARIAIQRRP
jgi:hypothetical protein